MKRNISWLSKFLSKRSSILRGVILFFCSIFLLLSIVSFSYAYFTISQEKRNVLNLVVGDFDYTLTGDKINGNHQVVIGANQASFVTLTLTSQNPVSSNYQLYYNETLPDGVRVLYEDSNTTLGSIDKIGATKTIKIVIENETNSSFTLTLGVKGGIVNNVIQLDQSQKAITELYTMKFPQITISPNTVTINAGTNYNLKSGVTAKDAYGKDLTSRLVVMQEQCKGAPAHCGPDYNVTWDNHTIGTTNIYYEVSDDYGVTVISEARPITVNRVYIYYLGNTYQSLTGGWTRYHTTANSPQFYQEYSPFEITSTGAIHGWLTSGPTRSVKSLFTYNQISLAPYKKLVFEVEGGNATYNGTAVGCYGSIYNVDTAGTIIEKRTTSKGTYELNVNALTSSCYIGGVMWSTETLPATTTFFSIKSVWLE